MSDNTDTLEFLKYIITNIVDDVGGVAVEDEVEDGITRYNITLAEDDYPKIIGKRGMTVKAITEIIGLFDMRNHPDNQGRLYINIQS